MAEEVKMFVWHQLKLEINIMTDQEDQKEDSKSLKKKQKILLKI